MLSLRTPLLAAAFAVFGATQALAASPAIYQSAAFVDFSGAEPGGYSIDASSGIGAVFQLAQAVDVTAIGGYFSEFSSGTLFGAIVPLTAGATLPVAAVDSSALAHVLFTPDGTDQTAALSVHLNAGTYGVVFGSGLWGATGDGALVSGQDSPGATLFTGAGSAWSSVPADSGVRLAVYGNVSAVPEPATWALLLAGLGALGFAARGRAKAR